MMQMNWTAKHKQAHRLRKQIYGYQREKVRGYKGEAGLRLTYTYTDYYI